MYSLIIVFTAILILAGFWGLFLPFLPGPPLVWLGIFLHSWYTGFEKISITTNLIFLGLVLFSFLVDYLATIYGAKRMGASRWGVIGAAIGLFLGLFSGGFFGLIIGPILGAFALEVVMAGKSGKKAIRAGFGAFLGVLGAALVKIAIVFVMTGIFVFRLFF